MTASELIEALKSMPPDAQVGMSRRDYESDEIDVVQGAAIDPAGWVILSAS